MPRLPPLAPALTLIAVPALFYALFLTVRFTIADSLARSGTVESITQAIQMSPDQARLYLQRAELAPSTASNDLRRAAELNPSSPAPWIALGLRAEASGNLKRAEQCLMEASRRDAGFTPRWSLVNFYFRQQRWDAFWHWAQTGAMIHHGDLKALFRLCLRADEDPLFTMKRVVPPRPETHRAFLELLIEQNRWDHAETAARAVLAHARALDIDLIVHVCERFIQNGRPDPAIRLWNGLTQRRLIPFQSLDPVAGLSLTNGRFRFPFTAKAFDWRPANVEGVILQQLGPDGRLRIEFSGRQPANCALLSQTMPMLPGRRYRVLYQYLSELSSPGCRWRLLDHLSPPLTQAASGSQASFELQVPAHQHMATLELISRHEPGYVRPEGRLEIESLQLHLLPY
ncbi:MAG: hypothetical protein JJE04_05970 [Acidobacteriia bacterium]|nr:hypothetical protein [Terriglobia bacterium]